MAQSPKGGDAMAHKLRYPKSETEFRKMCDEIYAITKECVAEGKTPKFEGMLEVISSESVILSAIHKLKANHGSQTPGSDGEFMRENILEKDYPGVISRVQRTLLDYHPAAVRRVYIPKPGKSEKRPLGIPTIIDRIIQECVRLVIEPMLEAQFFAHSYGFRPMREPAMALERLRMLIQRTGYHWVVEGDISKFFDNVDHAKLIKRLWHLGIQDKRVLMIIKAMLKAGIMGEIEENTLGTPQGGIISPLLANAYLDALDWWIAREWECKKTRESYTRHDSAIRALKKTNLKPAYLIRYADDWVLLTDSKENAEKWKYRISKYLTGRLNLVLSEEKTEITDVSKKPVKFLGFEVKAFKGKSGKYRVQTKPNQKKLKAKVQELHDAIRQLRKLKGAILKKGESGKRLLIDGINIINSQIRGVIQYYEAATMVNPALDKYARPLIGTAYCALKRYGGEWVPANQVKNLYSVHSKYTEAIPAIKYGEMYVGITSFRFCSWKMTVLKNQSETPYSEEGRALFRERTGKKPLLARADELLSPTLSWVYGRGLEDYKLYNFEYFLNRPYAFNRDRGKCELCGLPIFFPWEIRIHHIDPNLPLDQVNRVVNLATVHEHCHHLIHKATIVELEALDAKIRKKVLGFREKLKKSERKPDGKGLMLDGTPDEVKVSCPV
jgi:RNA-directed DNA polymerase